MLRAPEVPKRMSHAVNRHFCPFAKKRHRYSAFRTGHLRCID
jgi:hypothetical protein